MGSTRPLGAPHSSCRARLLCAAAACKRRAAGALKLQCETANRHRAYPTVQIKAWIQRAASHGTARSGYRLAPNSELTQECTAIQLPPAPLPLARLPCPLAGTSHVSNDSLHKRQRQQQGVDAGEGSRKQQKGRPARQLSCRARRQGTGAARGRAAAINMGSAAGCCSAPAGPLAAEMGCAAARRRGCAAGAAPWRCGCHHARTL